MDTLTSFSTSSSVAFDDLQNFHNCSIKSGEENIGLYLQMVGTSFSYHKRKPLFLLIPVSSSRQKFLLLYSRPPKLNGYLLLRDSQASLIGLSYPKLKSGQRDAASSAKTSEAELSYQKIHGPIQVGWSGLGSFK